MDNHLTTIQDLFTEFEMIKNNITRYSVYNGTVKVQLCTKYKKKYYLLGKPKVYTFQTLNLLNQFVNMLGNCELHKI